jgi:hypothetical protein
VYRICCGCCGVCLGVGYYSLKGRLKVRARFSRWYVGRGDAGCQSLHHAVFRVGGGGGGGREEEGRGGGEVEEEEVWSTGNCSKGCADDVVRNEAFVHIYPVARRGLVC